jgi:hypothetical protein
MIYAEFLWLQTGLPVYVFTPHTSLVHHFKSVAIPLTISPYSNLSGSWSMRNTVISRRIASVGGGGMTSMEKGSLNEEGEKKHHLKPRTHF